jgi:very-short-patch-repair endonuclease
MGEVEERCRALMARQHGLISRRQATQLGMSRNQIFWRVQSGDWEPVWRGVFRSASIRTSWLQKLNGLLLRAGERSAVSHRAAAALWRLDGVESGWPEITTSTRLRAGSEPKLLVHQTCSLEASDIVIVDGLRATTVTRTLIDSVSVLPFETAENAIECALRRKSTSVDRLFAALDRLGTGRSGARALREWLEWRGSGRAPTESDLETKITQLLRSSPLPDAVRQLWVKLPSGENARLDFAFPKQLVAIEGDGRAPHLREARWEEDHVRRSALASMGWLVIVITWRRLHSDPEGILADIAAALRSRDDRLLLS